MEQLEETNAQLDAEARIGDAVQLYTVCEAFAPALLRVCSASYPL